MSVTPALIELTLEQRQALELRAAGATFEEIGERQHVNKSTAKRRVDAALAATLREPADKLRELEAHRLDRMTVLVMQAAEVAVARGKSPLFAVDRLLRISEQRCRLFGLDAPTKRIVNVVTEDAIDVAIRELEAELAQSDSDGGDVGDRGAASEVGPLP